MAVVGYRCQKTLLVVGARGKSREEAVVVAQLIEKPGRIAIVDMPVTDPIYHVIQGFNHIRASPRKLDISIPKVKRF